MQYSTKNVEKVFIRTKFFLRLHKKWNMLDIIVLNDLFHLLCKYEKPIFKIEIKYKIHVYWNLSFFSSVSENEEKNVITFLFYSGKGKYVY